MYVLGHRNPYDPEKYTGGSSSGSAAAAASGIVPIAIGCDGGGSIRIPSSLTGLFGIKATFGRVPHAPGLCYSGINIIHVYMVTGGQVFLV
jgi:Asp-tRNA(Asn)/Glu-tRNA(Gln) amidotransferase A subunit family amidase